jgi:hypothetical protein
MPFNQEDFENKEINLKLLSIINDKLRISVLTAFSKLSKRQKVYFNEELNKYIHDLPDEGYLEVINKNFNTIMHDILTSEDFKPEQQRVQRGSTNPIEIKKEESVDDVLAKLEQELIKV